MKNINIPNSTEHYGSFILTEVKGNHKMFMGLSEDIELLPTEMEGTTTGSSAFCIDTGEVFLYEKSSQTWYQI